MSAYVTVSSPLSKRNRVQCVFWLRPRQTICENVCVRREIGLVKCSLTLDTVRLFSKAAINEGSSANIKEAGGQSETLPIRRALAAASRRVMQSHLSMHSDVHDDPAILWMRSVCLPVLFRFCLPTVLHLDVAYLKWEWCMLELVYAQVGLPFTFLINDR